MTTPSETQIPRFGARVMAVSEELRAYGNELDRLIWQITGALDTVEDIGPRAMLSPSVRTRLEYLQALSAKLATTLGLED